MEFGLLFDVERQLLSIGYRVADSTLDPSCYDLLASEARLASFVAIAKGDRADPTLVPPGTHAHASGRQRGAPLVVRIDVRILDARAGDARAARVLARRNEPSGRARAKPNTVRNGSCRGASRNRRTTREIWSSRISTRASAFRPRAQARPRRRRRRGALRDGSGGDGHASRGGAKLRASCRSGWTWPVRLVRGARLHASPSPGGRDGGDRACLHGAPSGHDAWSRSPMRFITA